MAKASIDLAGVFGAVTQALSENQQSLNQADEYNQDHGSNMVQTFQIITDALQQKKGGSASAALNYASKRLSQSTTSGSGQVYARNLSLAAGQLKGKSLDAQGAMQLLQTLIGGGQAEPVEPSSDQPAGGDLLSALLGGGSSSDQQPQVGGGDLLSALLGGGSSSGQQPQAGGGDLLSALLGGGSSSGQQPQVGGGDLLGALLGGLSGSGTAGQQPSAGGDLLSMLLGSLTGSGGGGGSVLQSLAQSFLGGSRMGDSAHRTQSTEVVVNSFLQALGSAVRR